MPDAVSRRGVLAGAAAFGALAVTACGGSDDDNGAASVTSDPPPSTGATGDTATVAALAKLADIKVGSAIAVDDAGGKPVIIARPTSTTAVGFSANCTHKGCPVKPDDAELQCPCHGSRFAATTGKVLNGPAEEPLRPFPVTVSGGDVLPA